MTAKSSIKFLAYKTNLGLILKSDTGYYPQELSKLYLINNRVVSPLNNNWFLLDDQEITSVKKKVPESQVQVGWELDSTNQIAGLGLPKTQTMEELKYFYNSSEEEYQYQGLLAGVGNLYKKVFETVPECWEDVDFEIQIIRNLEIENISKPVEMKIMSYHQGNFGVKPLEFDLKSVTTWDELEKILTPEFLLHERPCEISSQNLYKIIRTHIVQNLDRTKCKITSDYDFCFTVKRLVQVKPYVVKIEQYKGAFKSYNPPKFKNETITVKEVDCFEMTHDQGDGNGRGYKGYTIIPALKANNLKQLSEYLKQYLDDLITNLNTPVVECQHCNGTGHIVHQLKHPKGSV